MRYGRTTAFPIKPADNKPCNIGGKALGIGRCPLPAANAGKKGRVIGNSLRQLRRRNMQSGQKPVDLCTQCLRVGPLQIHAVCALRIERVRRKLFSLTCGDGTKALKQELKALLIGSTFPGAKAAQRCGRQTACLRQLLCGTVCQLHPFVESLGKSHRGYLPFTHFVRP